MLVLFDQGTPVPLRQLLPRHTIATAYERGGSRLKNGDLLHAAESAGFTVLVTTDMNLKYQQNLSARRIAVVVLTTTRWPRIRSAAPQIALAIDGAGAGSYIEVSVS